ncbi:hypothetical protein QF042_001730 [Pedobacter sp. W3I1]|nr:hypothetical protein [Pedobacter sp. W3I1]
MKILQWAYPIGFLGTSVDKIYILFFALTRLATKIIDVNIKKPILNLIA